MRGLMVYLAIIFANALPLRGLPLSQEGEFYLLFYRYFFKETVPEKTDTVSKIICYYKY